jgi:hypothetical protein
MKPDTSALETGANGRPAAVAPAELEAVVAQELAATPFVDLHTHLFGPSFGSLGL